MARMNCINIGTIVSFDPATQTASVSINFQKVLRAVNHLDGVGQVSDQIVPYPQLDNVPVVILGGGGAYITFPIAPGDSCILMFNDRDKDGWMAQGTTNPPLPPLSNRMHDISDAIALVGIRNLLNSIPSYNNDVASVVDRTGERLCQSGFLQPYAGLAAPSGWLLCYGQAVSRTTYDILFATIGITYGAGNGTTTFNLPDLRGRVTAGLDNMGGSNANRLTSTFFPNRNTPGGTGGEDSHQLTIAELPAHHHTILGGDSGNLVGGPTLFDAVSQNDTQNTANTGGDTPHQNVQPTMVINWIIKI